MSGGVGEEIQLAHPLKTKTIASATIKTDRIDATILAHLGRADLVPQAYIPPREVRDLREILRHRAFLVYLQTAVKNRIHSYLSKQGLEPPFTDLFGKSGLAWLRALEIREPYRSLLDQDLRILVLQPQLKPWYSLGEIRCTHCAQRGVPSSWHPSLQGTGHGI